MALGVGLYIIPLAMIANSALLEFANAPELALLSTVKTGIGLALISYGLIGYKNFLARFLAIVMGMIVIFTNIGSL